MVLRRVVGTEDKPYDTDWDGNVLTVRVDILECGHKKRANFDHHRRQIKGEGEGGDLSAVTRQCNQCDREGRS